MARSVVITMLVMLVLIVTLAYLLPLLPPVQERLRHSAQQALSTYLHTDVSIGSMTFTPFNQLQLGQVSISDQQGDSLLTIDKLGAGISLKQLITEGRIVITYGEIMGLQGHVTRPDKDSPTNLQFIIDALKPKQQREAKPFDVQINHVVVRRATLSYDVLNEPQKIGTMDFNHLSLSDVNADLSLPTIKNNDFDIDVRRLSLVERSGFILNQLSTRVHITDTALTAVGNRLKLPHSDIRLDDIMLHYSALKNLANELSSMPLSMGTSGSVITPSDWQTLLPQLAHLDIPLHLEAQVHKQGDLIIVPKLLAFSPEKRFSLDLSGHVQQMHDQRQLAFDVNHVSLNATSAAMANVASSVPQLSSDLRNLMHRLGDVKLNGRAQGTLSQVNVTGSVTTSQGDASVDGTIDHQGTTTQFVGSVKSEGLQLGRLLDKSSLLGQVAMDAQVEAAIEQKDVSGHLNGQIAYIDFKGNRYHHITADITKDKDDIEGRVALDDPKGRVTLSGKACIDSKNASCDIVATTEGVDLAAIGLTHKYPEHRLSMIGKASVAGNSLDNIIGQLQLSDVAFVDRSGKGLKIKELQIDADNTASGKTININSDHINGYVNGHYDFKTLLPTLKQMLSQAFPQFIGDYAYHQGANNDLEFSFELNPDEAFNKLLALPVSIVYKATIEGAINESSNKFDVVVDAPYLLQAGKLIEGTHLTAAVDSVNGGMLVTAQTLYPSKNGKIALNLAARGLDDQVATSLDWRVRREGDFYGRLDLQTQLGRDDSGKLMADIDVKPSQMVFNDTAWTVEPGHINIEHGVVTVDNLSGGHDDQYIHINGVASHNPDDELCLELSDISLDYIFNTLAINHVNFGGRATGKFYARDLFSKAPRLYTPNLHVNALHYNDANMGDADIQAHFDNDSKGVMLDAHISQANGYKSDIFGGIYVADDSLCINFDAHHANIAFLKPYMQAFTSDVAGEVSGKATLYGNFHTINLKGDVMADTLRFLIDHVNVYYSCAGDSVHFKPNLIYFNDVTISDRDGHTASFGGWLRHDSFHNPAFNFSITDAHDLLCYDTNSTINPDWYGTIYGDGSCFVTGEPGLVEIKVNMQSAPRSKFTFVLSDVEQADTYSFITFRDRNASAAPKPVAVDDSIPASVRMLTQRVQQEEEAIPTAYTIDLQGDITPDVALTVVMDPVGGDRIKATGSGHLRLTYNNNEELAMYGKYTLDKGTYNFTLQDVIIKDFTIREGSSISFQGDPYAAQLDLEAAYSLTANLKDLDESFSNDAEIKRTNVPVHALLRIGGAISQPDLDFDLEFPTLTTDAYRKVKSIISTDEMMNRQIIYLLALNRFYTPEYTSKTTTNQNDLFTSVASSTISSQLSNILGKMSDKFSISPNFRSDKGDFSDMEVDVALSSQLLNNRLLINGNFGYRDNTYNTNNSNFIGDFDIEYLLNAKGSLRLKAYNHFNDQNYYVRNALTTQGVGIVWKLDFDNLFRRNRQHDGSPATPDSTSTHYQPQAVKPDSAPMVNFRSANHQARSSQ